MIDIKKPIIDFFEFIKNSFPNFIITADEFQKNFISNKKSGMFGQITRGTHKGKQVAIKTLKLMKDSIKLVLKEKSEFELINRELTILSIISSDNIPSLEGIYINYQKDQINFILDYIDGKTLSEALAEDNNWTYYQKLLLAKKLCNILVDIRQNEVIHRDVKPDNIIIESNSYLDTLEPYLIDFGFSKIQNSDKTYTMTKGKCTPLYSPPENLLDEQDYMKLIDSSEKSLLTPVTNKGLLTKISYKVDVWSFGCVLYEIFTRRKPWVHIIESKYPNRKNQLDVNDIFSFFNGKDKIFSSTDKANYPKIMNIVENCTIISVKERWEIEKVYSTIYSLIQSNRSFVKEEEDGIYYEGQIIKSKAFTNNEETYYDGFGKYKIDDDDEEEKVIYIGNYEFSKKSGLGIHQTVDNIYYGYWRNDDKNGLGYNYNTEYNINYYIGKFKKNKKDGYGMYIIKDESIYIGKFCNDMLIEGIYFDIVNNLVYKGMFEYEQLVIGEIHYLEKNEIYYGQIKNNKRNGYGQLLNITNNKVIQRGLWKNDAIIIKSYKSN